MGYRIFFSFQSDSPKELNYVFIRDAIKKAMSKISDYDIEEPLRIGFREKGGNPPLLEAMLDQSRESDIVISDVTFTSSKIWQTPPTGFTEDEGHYFIEIPKNVNLKPAPNPNVLLETGYSWALKDFERTILVMNEAFGHPKNFPVDMEGLRYPISYNLSDTKSTDFKKIFNNLVESIKQAISDAIKSSIRHQINELRPLITHETWKKDHPFPYCKGQYANSLILDIINLIKNYRNPIRVIGSDCIGKTRLLIESLYYDSNKDKLANISIYYDLSSPLSNSAIFTQLNIIKEKRQFIILVFNNCPLDEHKKLEKFFRGSMVKFISIDSSDDIEKDVADIKISDDLLHENFRNITKTHFPSMDYSTIMDSTNGDLDQFILSISSGADSKEIVKSFNELLPIIIGTENMRRGAIPLLTSVKLFKMVGVSGQRKNQIQFINSFFIKEEIDETEILIENLISKNLLRQQGDFILDNGLDVTLINDWINSQDDIDISLLIKKVSENNMWASFKDHFFKLMEQKDYLNQIQEEAGILQDDDFINSQVGKDFLNILADKHRKLVLEVLKRKIIG
ncbi:hypothetical protein [Mariniflexile sp. AS56]|uniref:hypothetical protein n=1 Tax=Mariniflexile sp. AS56 TaxID=3063957 RepID=UPI0026EC899B|nr:hypothetical protein [Mariniflexile sp. AS56]MDO7173709.1 hypothetical protein [Mariniflexile sp. AS56]